MTRNQKFILLRIIISALCFAGLMVFAAQGEINLLLFLIPYFIIGYDVLWKALCGVLRGHILDERFLMTVATVGAIILEEYPEALAVMLFYQLGELLLSVSVNRNRKNIADLMDIYPSYAVVIRDGKVLRCEPDEVRVGETILVRNGERVPLDGIISEGSGSLDTSCITGESALREVCEGDRVVSGSVNVGGMIKVKVTAEYKDSTVSRILELVEEAADKKSKTESFITRFSMVYTPVVVISAAVLATVPSLITGNWAEWTHRALIFLVVSCPCALVISVPLSFFGGIGGSAKRGILIKGSCYMEQLAKSSVVVFDKTGTLTHGSFDVVEISSLIDKDEFIKIAATAEQGSDHPVAECIRELYKGEVVTPGQVEVVAGKGVISDNVKCGNHSFMKEQGIECEKVVATGSVVYIARDDRYIGHIVVAGRIKANSAEAIEDLHSLGIFTVMLTGDNMAAARAVADVIGIDEFHWDLLPDGKVAKLGEITADAGKNNRVCYVGDGINDAPVLACADVGIAMGGIGSDAAIEAADIVIMDDDPAKVAEAVYLSQRTMKIVKQNIIFCLGVKALVLILGALGIAGMWAAIFADVGISVLASLNALRCMRVRSSDDGTERIDAPITEEQTENPDEEDIEMV